MKFWELTSVCRDQPDLLKNMLQSCGEDQLLEWIREIDEIITRQDRIILDKEIDDDICLAVLSKHTGKLYQSTRYLRAYPMENKMELTFVDIFKKYGGSIIEETLEKGIAILPK
ncbi:MAG: hypothetical protein BWK73_44580 [Thiothrix lacustris]|uniref:Uncharacterized protein n=1 Tax=Thiothrix lacustris TaxID=525917 RepID=A0A1Y1QBE8_9GAMM|nr:MAG: hypothetical protein BWK73_44580 [Thiothrix lacustris]